MSLDHQSHHVVMKCRKCDDVMQENDDYKHIEDHSDDGKCSNECKWCANLVVCSQCGAYIEKNDKYEYR